MIIFVIKTSKYAGNFEREICAYMTGQIGDCEVGKAQAEKAKNEAPIFCEKMEEIILQKSDDNGCWRPVGISGNDVEIYFEELPNEDDIEVLKQRACEYLPEVIGFGLQEEIITRVTKNLKL